jgi:glycerophosphoryl diester phosphodiesterase
VTTHARTGGDPGGEAAGRPLVVARAGAPGAAPEHTIPAYEAAIRAGADLLLVDVHLSADDQLVVMRDARLERTTDGRGRVRDRTLRELKRLDAGRWFGRAFRGQRIQTLSEVLERFRDRAGFVVALARGSDVYPGIEERVVGLLQVYQLSEPALVVSVDHVALLRCHELDPEVPLGAVAGARLLAPERLAPPGVLRAVCLEAGLTTAREVAACRGVGLDAYVLGVDEAVAARGFAALGAAGLVTDRPDLLRAVLG